MDSYLITSLNFVQFFDFNQFFPFLFISLISLNNFSSKKLHLGINIRKNVLVYQKTWRKAISYIIAYQLLCSRILFVVLNSRLICPIVLSSAFTIWSILMSRCTLNFKWVCMWSRSLGLKAVGTFFRNIYLTSIWNHR